ncbi:MAG: hypothetical protein ACR2IQ_01990, partial [Minisyncoccia bacterium]
PTHSVTISKCILNSIENMSGKFLLQQIEDRINLVKGDFRQKEILKLWNKSINDEVFVLLHCTAEVSSGTYIRQLAMDIGNVLGVPALAYNIERTNVGPYCLQDIPKDF